MDRNPGRVQSGRNVGLTIGLWKMAIIFALIVLGLIALIIRHFDTDPCVVDGTPTVQQSWECEVQQYR